MKFNPETLTMMLKFGGAMLGLLLLVFLIAIITPKLAKLIDRLLGLNPKATHPKEAEYKVKDIWMGELNEASGAEQKNPAEGNQSAADAALQSDLQTAGPEEQGADPETKDK
jgi:hypothetical protein